MKKINIYTVALMLCLHFCAYAMHGGESAVTSPVDVAISMGTAGPLQTVVSQKQKISHAGQVQAIVARMQELQGMIQDVANLSTATPRDTVAQPLAKTDKGKQKGDQQNDQKNSNTPAASPKMYTEEELLQYVAAIPPQLAEFGKTHNLSVSELEHFGQLLQEFHIDPQAMAGIMNQFHGTNQSAKGRETQEYKSMQENQPEDYTQLMLGVFKTLSEDLSVEKKSSPLSAAHVGVQNNIIADQDSTIYMGKIFTMIHLLVTVGGFIWAIYNQVHGGGTATPINGTVTG